MRLFIQGKVHRFLATQDHEPTTRPTLCGIVATYKEWRVVMPGDGPMCEECETKAVELRLVKDAIQEEIADALGQYVGRAR